ncbi:MAG TPA: hypothetical protein DDW84_07220 [Phycisphaerales bacterium]|nr:hypothetical protein [Phycisphaerales bacterium]HBR20687.1 hypothetical protein [Phycisphaerales bacterium]
MGVIRAATVMERSFFVFSPAILYGRVSFVGWAFLSSVALAKEEAHAVFIQPPILLGVHYSVILASSCHSRDLSRRSEDGRRESIFLKFLICDFKFRLSALKGHNISAQGNALGKKTEKILSPERA